MVLCKFFREGYCRYGSSCRFEHSQTSKYSYQAPSQTTSTHQHSEVTTEQLIYSVKNDVNSAINGKQWLLSAYGPFSKKNFPGFHDVSPEEVRLALYEAKANNSVDKAIVSYNTMIQEASSKLNRLLNPDTTIVKTMTSIYKQEGTPNPFGISSSFREQATPKSVFGGQNPSGVFGQTSVFGGQTTSPESVFGQANASSVFGGQNKNQNAFTGQSTTQSVFGGQNSSSIFGGQSSSPQSVFGGTGSSTAQKVFGGQNANAQNVFGGQNSSAQNVFGGGATAQSVFGGKSPTSQNVFGGDNSGLQNVFGQSGSDCVFGVQKPATPQSVFGGPSSPASVFSSPTPENVFGTQNKNVFGNQSQSTLGQNVQAQSVFGQSNSNVHGAQTGALTPNVFAQTNIPQTESSPFGQSANSTRPIEDCYSRLDELSAECLQQYKSEKFEFGFIPEMPPPQELCF